MQSAGVGEQSMFAKGLPRNLGDPAVSTSVSRRQRIEAPARRTDEEPANSNSPLPTAGARVSHPNRPNYAITALTADPGVYFRRDWWHPDHPEDL